MTMIYLLLSFVCCTGGEEPLDLPAEGRVTQLRRLLPIQRQHRQSSHGSLVLFNILIMATVMLKCFMFCASIKVKKILNPVTTVALVYVVKFNFYVGQCIKFTQVLRIIILCIKPSSLLYFNF